MTFNDDSKTYMWVGAMVLTIYLLCFPFISRTWQATGDEPHYLLAAHSLVVDSDFDLRNNYEDFDYLAFYVSRDISRQIRVDGVGREILNHYPALSFVVAPAYALGGQWGVLLFQVLLGGGLAAITFRLAWVVSEDTLAAVVGTASVMLTAPLFLYHYLVYPEMIAALLTTFVLYYTIHKTQPSTLTKLLVWGALLILPWFNRRFVMVALLLAVLIVLAWRKEGENGLRGVFLSKGWLGVGILLLSIGGLMWFNHQLQAPSRVDITIPTEGAVIWERLFRGVGWLVDQQKGLFIYSPIYMVAVFGLPFLGQKGQGRKWVLLLPFILSLGMVALAGGYWIAWEVGPRYLVVALPALAPLIALAWRHYGQRTVGRLLIALLFFMSVANTLVIVTHPDLPYKSSLPLFYGERTGLPFTEILPDLATKMIIVPLTSNTGTAELVTEAGETVWFAKQGQAESLVIEQLENLPFGHYYLTWPVRVEGNISVETKLLRLTTMLVGGGQLFSRIVTAADLPSDGTYHNLRFSFFNYNVDRWQTSPVLQVMSTGQSNVWAKSIRLDPNPIYAWLLPYGWLLVLAIGAIWAYFLHVPSSRRSVVGGRAVACKRRSFSFLAILFPLFALIYVTNQHNQPTRVYEAESLYHHTGQGVVDEVANNDNVWLVDPLRNEPGKAIYGPFDFYEAGVYEVTFQLKLTEAVAAEDTVAVLKVQATTNFDDLVTQPLMGSHFTEANHYHQFVLTVNNPRRQALSFGVDYTGVAGLVIDEVRVETVVD